jgi:hypothetical protein
VLQHHGDEFCEVSACGFLKSSGRIFLPAGSTGFELMIWVARRLSNTLLRDTAAGCGSLLNLDMVSLKYHSNTED